MSNLVFNLADDLLQHVFNGEVGSGAAKHRQSQ
jgi:hypothetical protein